MSFLCHICYRANKRENRSGNQEWTFQTLATLDTQDTGQRHPNTENSKDEQHRPH